jgi:phosphoglycerate dehydrogenase-like enzyme
MIRVAVLDDYQHVAESLADWATLDGRAEVIFFHDHLADPSGVIARLGSFDAVCLMRERTPLPALVIAALPRLRLIVTTGMGNASVDVDAARARDISYCGTEMTGPDTPELSWLLAATLLRGFVVEAASVRTGGWQRTVGRRISGATIGLLGLGNIGGAVARYAQAFGMDVLAWSQNLTQERAHEYGARYVSEDELFTRSDVVSIHVRLSERTRGLVTARHLELLGPQGYLVNTSRGPIVVESDLVHALNTGVIAGAAIDTFDVEPLPPAHPLRTAQRGFPTPHIGYVTRESFEQCYAQTLEDVVAWLDGSPVRVID